MSHHHIILHRLLYNIQPLMLLARALALPVWVAVPLLQVVLGVFPWRVNRWFGITAVVYYGVATPLLYQVHSQTATGTLPSSPADVAGEELPIRG